MEAITTSTVDTMQDSGVAHESGSAQGLLDITEDFNILGTVSKTYSFAGTTWLNNLTQGGAADSNLWASFPWEYPFLWLNERDLLNAFLEFQFWKPVKVIIEFGNAQNYQQITTGTTPFMIPTTQGRIVLYRDDYYFSNIFTNTPFSGSQTPRTAPELASIRASFTQSGYNNDATVFLPNNDTVVLGGTRNAYINNPCAKWLRIGNGHKITQGWNFHNKYWRTTAELVANQGQAGTVAPNPFRFWRADELLGAVRMSDVSTGVAVATKQISYLNTLDSGNIAPNQGISAQASAAVLAGSVAYADRYTDPTPQPALFLQLIPDIGVQGATGTSSCQVDFKITYILEFTGKLPFSNNQSATASFGTIDNQPSNFRPTFIPINRNFID